MPPNHSELPDQVELSHEQILEKALICALDGFDLPGLAEEHGHAPLRDRDGDPVEITAVNSLYDKGTLTSAQGIVIELSDGSAFTAEIACYQRPSS